MVDAVRSEVHRLLVEERLSPEGLVVMTTRAVDRSPVFAKGKLGNYTLVEQHEAPGPDRIRFVNLFRFKGLEADTVILCDVEPGATNCSPRHLYVGASRARHVLVVASYTH